MSMERRPFLNTRAIVFSTIAQVLKKFPLLRTTSVFFI